MSSLRDRRSEFDIGLRMLADVIMINAALILAMVLRYFVEMTTTSPAAPHMVLAEYVSDFLSSFWVLTIIAMAVFYATGFYTHGRYYQGRYKALVVAQAVSLAFLIFGFVAFLSRGAIHVPRSVLFIGWFLACLFLIAARLWSMLWKAMYGTVGAGPASPGKPSKSKQVLVIGGAGYIGSALLPKLLDRGYHVRLLDLFLYGREPIVKVAAHPNLELIRADFRHIDRVVQAMKGVDEVVHLGAIVGDPACSLNEELTVEVNLMATRMIAEVAKGSGCRRFCFASTCSVYGASDEILDERSALNPLSLYARSKLASERVLLQMASEHFSPVILRFGTIYGLSGRTRFDLIVNLLTAKAVRERKITVFGGGQWRPFLHVDDAALALLKALEAPAGLVHEQIFNVGSTEQNYQLGAAAEIIRAHVPEAEVVDMGADTDFRNYRVEFGKIRKTLAFVPQWTLEQGVQQVIGALKSGEVRDYRSPMYSNVKYLSEEGTTRLIRNDVRWAYDLLKSTESVEQPV